MLTFSPPLYWQEALLQNRSDKARQYSVTVVMTTPPEDELVPEAAPAEEAPLPADEPPEAPPLLPLPPLLPPLLAPLLPPLLPLLFPPVLPEDPITPDEPMAPEPLPPLEMAELAALDELPPDAEEEARDVPPEAAWEDAPWAELLFPPVLEDDDEEDEEEDVELVGHAVAAKANKASNGSLPERGKAVATTVIGTSSVFRGTLDGAR